MARLRLAEGWGTLALAAFITVIVVSSVESSTWVKGTEVLMPEALLGVILALALAKTGLRAWLSLPALAGGGVAVTLWLQTPLLVPEDAFQVGRPLLLALGDRVHAWSLMTGRVVEWLRLAAASRAGSDNQVFLLFLALMVFAASAWLAWACFRQHRAWPALLPGAAIMVSNTVTGPNNQSGFFVVWLAAGLLLVARLHLANLQRHWRARRIRASGDLLWNFLQRAGSAVLLLVLASWFVPSVGAGVTASQLGSQVDGIWLHWSTFWDRVAGGSHGRGSPQVSGFSMVVDPSGPLVQASTPVMRVVTTSTVQPFWAGAVLSYFDGNRWAPQGGDWVTLEQPLSPGTPLWEGTPLARTALDARFTLLGGPPPVLFAPIDPLQSDQGLIGRRYAPSGDSLAGAGWQTLAPTQRASSYRSVGAVSTADAVSLRQATTDYPPSLTAANLELPPAWRQGNGAHITELAQVVTAGLTNPYDRAVALQDYLRSHYTYDLKVAAPPPGEGSLSWFLFHSHRGYCQMYASSMGAMLRSLSIPARLVNGYQAGHRTNHRGVITYLVRESDAHTIVEAYLPPYGWIAFEPTAGSPVFTRQPAALGAAALGEHGAAAGGAGVFRDRLSSRNAEPLTPVTLPHLPPAVAPLTVPWRGIALTTSILAGALFLAAVAFFAARRPSAVWRRLGWCAHWAGAPLRSADTPSEAIARLRRLFPRWLGADAAALSRLAELEGRRRYSSSGLHASSEAEYAAAWGRLRGRWWALPVDFAALALRSQARTA